MPQDESPRKALALDACFVALLVGGAASVAYGAFLLHPAAGWIVGGVAAIVGALKVLP